MPENKGACSCKGTVLVTGGGGYIGSHTVVELLKENYKVVVIDNMSNCYGEENDKPESLKRVELITGKPVGFHKVDIRDRAELQKIFSSYKFATVLHFAALKAVGESVQQPLKYYQNNIAGTATLLEVSIVQSFSLLVIIITTT